MMKGVMLVASLFSSFLILIMSYSRMEHVKPYSALMAFAIMINYIIGSGLFSLPSAFIRAGWLLSSACLASFAALSYVCLQYTIESMARAAGIQSYLYNQQQLQYNESDALLISKAKPNTLIATQFRPELDYIKYDFNQLSLIFTETKWLYYFTQLILISYTYCVLWGSTAIFASSLDTLIFPYIYPNQNCNIYINPTAACTNIYTLCVIAFAAVAIVISLLDVAEQARLQSFLTIYRFFAFGLMMITCIYAIAYGNNTNSNYTLSTVRWSGFGFIFCFSGVALNVHFNAPDIFQPLSDKSAALTVGFAGMLCSAVLYVAVGLFCAIQFGPSTLPLVTLNWSNYTGIGGGFEAGEASAFALIIRLLIMAFPIVNQLSLFPLLCVTLGDNLVPIFNGNVHKKICRLFACIPPLLLALFIGKLDQIFTITGNFAFFLELIIPCLFQLLSIEYVRERFGEGAEITQYSGRFSSKNVVYLILAISIVAFLISAAFTL
jgi:amino acid permease